MLDTYVASIRLDSHYNAVCTFYYYYHYHYYSYYWRSSYNKARERDIRKNKVHAGSTPGGRFVS